MNKHNSNNYNNRTRINNAANVKKRELRPECRSMCPEEEVNMRIKNNLVHALEKRIVNSKLEYKMVKEYSRPAADKYIKSENLRTTEALMSTALYLVNELENNLKVYSRIDVDYMVRYEFIFDRFRAIRQDLTIQRSHDDKCLRILEIILCFYLLADYKLFSSKNYDEFINSQHLNEVLNFLMLNEKCEKKRAYFLSAFILLNLENTFAITNILKYPVELKTEFPLNRCIDLSKAYLNRNFVRIFAIYRDLPLFCQLALHRKIPLIENEMMRSMSWAYSFKNVKYPIENLLKISVFRNKYAMQRFVEAHLITLDPESETVTFNKATSNTEIKNQRDYVDLVDNKIPKMTDEINFILGKDFELE